MQNQSEQILENKTSTPEVRDSRLLDKPEGVSDEQWIQWHEDAKGGAVTAKPVTPERETRIVEFDCETHGKTEIELLIYAGKEIGARHCLKCYDERVKRESEERAAREAENEEKARAYAIQRRMRIASIPLRFEKCSFDNYIPDGEKAEKALSTCRSYAEGFQNNLQNGAGMILCGNTGTGKTHLAAAIASEVLKRNHVIYTTTIKALRRIKSTYAKGSDETEQQAINHYVKPDLLILDEVGVQYGSDSEHNLIFEIMNDRYENMKPTIIISNLSLGELRGLIGDRVIDRQRENGGKLLVFEWDSARGNKNK